jgi:4-hydroxy-2-oxoheptanedioate aldolase
MQSTKTDRFRKQLENGQCVGIFSKTTDSGMVEAAGHSGLDFIILDMEHGPIGQETLHHHVRAADNTRMASIVRVNGHDPDMIGSVLDSGADGVQVPNISTAAQARQAVAAARYHPDGNRGVCRFVRAADFGTLNRDEYLENANKTIIVLQVEGLEGIGNLDEILEVPGFDVLFVGPYDLSQSVGKPGQVDDPGVLKLIGEIAAKAEKKGVALGVFTDTNEAIRAMAAAGFSYLAHSVDQNIFSKACSGVLDNLSSAG